MRKIKMYEVIFLCNDMVDCRHEVSKVKNKYRTDPVHVTAYTQNGAITQALRINNMPDTKGHSVLVDGNIIGAEQPK